MKGKFIIIAIVLLVTICLLPLIIDAVIFGNSIPSNLTNAEWAGFLGNYIGSLIGGTVSLVGIVLTIRFTKRQIDINKEQYEEQKRLNNIPILDCKIVTVMDGEDPRAVKMNVEYTLCNKKEFQNYTIEFAISNIGAGTATDLKYGMEVGGVEQDGVFWLWENRVIKNQDSLFQGLVFQIPEDTDFKPTMLIFYEDVLGNCYVKRINLVVSKNENNNCMFCILSQDKGTLIPKKKYEKMHYVINSMEPQPKDSER